MRFLERGHGRPRLHLRVICSAPVWAAPCAGWPRRSRCSHSTRSSSSTGCAATTWKRRSLAGYCGGMSRLARVDGRRRAAWTRRTVYGAARRTASLVLTRSVEGGHDEDSSAAIFLPMAAVIAFAWIPEAREFQRSSRTWMPADSDRTWRSRPGSFFTKRCVFGRYFCGHDPRSARADTDSPSSLDAAATCNPGLTISNTGCGAGLAPQQQAGDGDRRASSPSWRRWTGRP